MSNCQALMQLTSTLRLRPLSSSLLSVAYMSARNLPEPCNTVGALPHKINKAAGYMKCRWPEAVCLSLQQVEGLPL